MVDLALMSKLVTALKPEARLILLGDANQLSSVEAGAVLGDICGRKTTPTGLRERRLDAVIVHLTKSYRFRADPGIGQLSRLINQGSGPLSFDRIRHDPSGEVRWFELPPPEGLEAAIRTRLLPAYRRLVSTDNPTAAFQQFGAVRIICALRKGPYGAEHINLMLERLLIEEGFINGEPPWYRGRPIMITRNDYTLNLFNGDIGILLPDAEDDQKLKAVFETAPGQYQKYQPLRLGHHETVFALTVHKSQGSEFERVILILPDQETPVLTRELLYTGITRARRSVEIWGREGVLIRAIESISERHSGLEDALVDEPG